MTYLEQLKAIEQIAENIAGAASHLCYEGKGPRIDNAEIRMMAQQLEELHVIILDVRDRAGLLDYHPNTEIDNYPGIPT